MFLGEDGYNLDLQLHYGVCEDRLCYQPQVSISHLDTCKRADGPQEAMGSVEERDLFQISDFIIFLGDGEKCEIIYLIELKD